MIESLNTFKENIINSVGGLIAFSVTEIETGASYIHHSNHPDFDVETEASFNLEVLKAKARSSRALNLEERIVDITTTFENQTHIIDVSEDANYFIYIAFDTREGNLLITKSILKRHKQGLELNF